MQELCHLSDQQTGPARDKIATHDHPNRFGIITETNCSCCIVGTYQTGLGMAGSEMCKSCSTCNSTSFVEYGCNSSMDTQCSSMSKLSLNCELSLCLVQQSGLVGSAAPNPLARSPYWLVSVASSDIADDSDHRGCRKFFEKLKHWVEIGRRRRPRQSRRTISGTAGATKCLSRGSVGSRPGLRGLEEKEKVQRRCPPSLRRNSLV